VTRSAKTNDRSRSGGNAVQAEALAPTVASGPPGPGIVDLFAGIGCVADGFAAEGFERLALLDVDADARRTYLHNVPDANYLLRDVSRLTAADVGEIVGDAAVAGVVAISRTPPSSTSVVLVNHA
jgi:predicted RNA methylase